MIDPRRPSSEVRKIWLQVLVSALLVAAVAAAGITLIECGRSRRAGAHAQPLLDPFSVSPAEAQRLAAAEGQRASPAPAHVAGSGPAPGRTAQGCSSTPRASSVVVTSVCIDAPMVDTHVAHGQLLIPPDVRTVGYDRESAALTSVAGTSIIAGHVDNLDQGPGSFFDLHAITAGAIVTVTDRTGRSSRWAVYQSSVVSKSQLPSSIWDLTGPKRLVLVTCGGPLLHTAAGNTYADNVLVYAVPMAGSAQPATSGATR